jgi:hypothetical protein
MSQEMTLYRGTRGDNILQAIQEGAIRPGADNRVWFSRILEDALKHGADMDRRETYAIKAVVTLIAGATVEQTAVHGNPLAVVITSQVSLPIKVHELYVRRPRGDRLETVTGAEAIRAYLIRARNAGSGGSAT